jgi:hypothetical protein
LNQCVAFKAIIHYRPKGLAGINETESVRGFVWGS